MQEKLTRCERCQIVQAENTGTWRYVLYEPSGRWQWCCPTCVDKARQSGLNWRYFKTANELTGG